MSSDVEMQDDEKISKPTTPTAVPPTSASSRASSVNSAHSSSSNASRRHKSPERQTEAPGIVVVVVEDVKPSVVESATSSAKPASTKPKSTKPPRPRSPSPSPPPPPPPPLQTIRLEITLGGPDNYEVDIAGIAKATGQRPATPVLVKRDTSDSEGDDEGEGDKPKSKKKRKTAAAEYYDTSDPFIDDSELAVDERTYFAQTKQQGFYVSSGEVALMKDNKTTPKKPKSRKPGPSESAPIAGPSGLSTVHREGTKDSPIALNSDGEEDKIGQKRKRYITVIEGGKKRKVVDPDSFHPELQASIEDLKLAIAKENWEAKGKFPPSIKPILANVALQAIKLDEYDDHFFNLMPTLFPYNKYTMSKLIKRTIFQDHLAILVQRQEALLADLQTQATAGFDKAREEWEKSVAVWEKRQEKVKAEAEAASADGTNTNANPTASSTTLPSEAPIRLPTEDAGSGMDQDVPPKEKDAAKEPHPPQKKYRMTESIKWIVWALVNLSNDCCRLENERNQLEGSTVLVSEQGLRKNLYQKIVAAFPDGWMSTGQISRDVSSMKKKMEKESMEQEP